MFEPFARADQRQRGEGICEGCCWTGGASRWNRWPPGWGEDGNQQALANFIIASSPLRQSSRICRGQSTFTVRVAADAGAFGGWPPQITQPRSFQAEAVGCAPGRTS